VVWFEGRERLADGLGVLGGEERALDVTAIVQVLQDFLADQLALAVTVGGEDDLVTRFERCRDRLEFDRLVAFGCRPGGVEPVRFQQHACPALPRGIDLVRLGQPQEMALRRKDLSEPVAERCAQIPSLARLFRDDQGRHARHPTQFGATAYPLSGNIDRKCWRRGGASRQAASEHQMIETQSRD
jgi:hypothetical protein